MAGHTFAACTGRSKFDRGRSKPSAASNVIMMKLLRFTYQNGFAGPVRKLPGPFESQFCLAGHTFAIAVRSLGPAAGVALAALVAQSKSRGHGFNDYSASVLTWPNTFFKQVVKNFSSAVVQFKMRMFFKVVAIFMKERMLQITKIR